MNTDDEQIDGDAGILSIRISRHLVSDEALLKACYWFSGKFVLDIRIDGDFSVVTLSAAAGSSTTDVGSIRESFISLTTDFGLRERVTAKTSDIRDLLLAKAFSESGVLEDEPRGIFGDAIEEAKPDGMFKILSNT